MKQHVRGPMLEHHIFTRQQLKRIAGKDKAYYRRLEADRRNLMLVTKQAHDAHHNASPKLGLWQLPDSAFEFGAEVFGAGKAYNALRRNYSGEDPRLEALLG